MKQPEENTNYLVKFKEEGTIRMARFNGFGEAKGWGGMDWAGDSGLSTDSWMHDDLEWWIELDRLISIVDTMMINGG